MQKSEATIYANTTPPKDLTPKGVHISFPSNASHVSKHSVLVPFGFQWAFAKDDAAGSGSQKKIKNSDTFTSRSPCFARVRLEAKKAKYVFASNQKHCNLNSNVVCLTTSQFIFQTLL